MAGAISSADPKSSSSCAEGIDLTMGSRKLWLRGDEAEGQGIERDVGTEIEIEIDMDMGVDVNVNMEIEMERGEREREGKIKRTRNRKIQITKTGSHQGRGTERFTDVESDGQMERDREMRYVIWM